MDVLGGFRLVAVRESSRQDLSETSALISSRRMSGRSLEGAMVVSLVALTALMTRVVRGVWGLSATRTVRCREEMTQVDQKPASS